MCYSNIIMDKDSAQTPRTPQDTTPPRGEIPQPQYKATKPQDSTAKRRWLARFVNRLTWQQATGVAFGIFIAPIVIAIILINVSGATLLDGLFGIYRNSPLQSGIVSLSMLAVPLGPLCALIFAIYFATRRKDLAGPKRVMPLALPVCVFSVALLSVLLES